VICPYCRQTIPEPNIHTAIQIEKEIWNPFMERFYMPDSWTESAESGTLDYFDYQRWVHC
jgi:hypothetical protein